MKKGANESTKALNRGMAGLVVLAADTQRVKSLYKLRQSLGGMSQNEEDRDTEDAYSIAMSRQ